MDKVQIKVVAVEVADIKKYQQMTVTHKTQFGKTEAKKLLSFVTGKDVWDRLKDSKKDDCFEIGREKTEDGKFWNWVEIAKIAELEEIQSTTKNHAAPAGNTYAEKNALDKERFEFEKTKQPLIIRQSCIGYAVAYMAAFNKGTTWTPTQVLEVAIEFEDYVKRGVLGGIDSLSNDIPY